MSKKSIAFLVIAIVATAAVTAFAVAGDSFQGMAFTKRAFNTTAAPTTTTGADQGTTTAVTPTTGVADQGTSAPTTTADVAEPTAAPITAVAAKPVKLSCSNTWKKVLVGEYQTLVGEGPIGDRVDLFGITQEQLKGLIVAINQGCDVKIGFTSSSGSAYEEPTFICDSTFSMDNSPDETYVGCTTSTPLVSNTNFDKDSEFLYDVISFWTQEGSVKLSKDRTAHWLSDWVPTTSSFFINGGGEYPGKWQVSVFLRK